MSLIIASAFSCAITTSMDLQVTTAEEAINYVGEYVPLTISWSEKLTRDENMYYAASMSATGQDPKMQAEIAIDSAKYSEDNSESSISEGNLGNNIDILKYAASNQTNQEEEQYTTLPELFASNLQVSNILAQSY